MVPLAQWAMRRLCSEHNLVPTTGVDDGEDAQKDYFKSEKEGENFKQERHDGTDSARGRNAEKIQIRREESASQKTDTYAPESFAKDWRRLPHNC
jgi:hypothetical protein